MPSRELKRARDSEEGNEQRTKAVRSTSPKEAHQGRCSVCELWVHASKCTELTATDLIDKRVTENFKCKGCLLQHDADNTIVMAEAPQTQNMPPENILTRILAEV